MYPFKPHIPAISHVHCEPIDLKTPFEQTVSRFAADTGCVALLSGGDLDCAGHHILALNPWLSFRGRASAQEIRIGQERFCFIADPLDCLKTILEACTLPSEHPDIPVGAGLFGYLAYDLKDCLEDLPRTCLDDLHLPHICLFAPSVILVHTKKDGLTRACLPVFKGRGENEIQSRLTWLRQRLDSPEPESGTFEVTGKPVSNFQRAAYQACIGTIKDYIAAGHVYQVNMSQRFAADFKGDAHALFQRLYQANPAPFFAFVQAGDHQVVSTSPERFILRQGPLVETRPIKGTRPRSRDAAADRENRLALAQSPKDDAELSMIVDLLRNDLGKVCKGQSVRVAEHKRLEAYQNVYHLVSIVEGEMLDGKDSVDLIRAVFPGGSITGCPKIRAMEIIDELEPCTRHVYTGAIGYIGFHDTLDLSIAIRTAVVQNGKLVFSVGGGIVYDSDPAEEFAETLHKGQTFLQALGGGDAREGSPGPMVWHNGRIQPLDQTRIPVDDQGVFFGCGIYETLRADGGRPAFLERHIERFNQAWQAVFDLPLPDLTWGEIIAQVLAANRLDHHPAAVKILATRGTRQKPPYDITLTVLARPYIHRLLLKPAAGQHVLTYPHPRLSPLADYKTTNYLYYLLAGRWAAANGADEALILNSDQSVSETHSASILLIRGRQVIHPVSPHVLPGTMAAAVSDHLARQGWTITKERLGCADLLAGDPVIMTNSLIGAVPVLSLDHQPLPLARDLCRDINAAFGIVSG